MDPMGNEGMGQWASTGPTGPTGPYHSISSVENLAIQPGRPFFQGASHGSPEAQWGAENDAGWWFQPL